MTHTHCARLLAPATVKARSSKSGSAGFPVADSAQYAFAFIRGAMSQPSQNAELSRSDRYRRIAADPMIASRTHFFSAAVLVTKALSSRDQPRFLSQLGAILEVANLRRAREIRSGKLSRTGSTESNTADFISFEQSL